MHIKSERGSGDIVWIGLIGLVVLAAVLMFGMAANSKGMAEGAETIANTSCKQLCFVAANTIRAKRGSTGKRLI